MLSLVDHMEVVQVQTAIGLEKIFKKIKKIVGPIMILVRIERSNQISKRVGLEPLKIKNRFMDSL